MARTVCPLVSAADRPRLAAILADRNRPQKHAARARIIRNRRLTGTLRAG
jgi:hypothetical protein